MKWLLHHHNASRSLPGQHAQAIRASIKGYIFGDFVWAPLPALLPPHPPPTNSLLYGGLANPKAHRILQTHMFASSDPRLKSWGNRPTHNQSFPLAFTGVRNSNNLFHRSSRPKPNTQPKGFNWRVLLQGIISLRLYPEDIAYQLFAGYRLWGITVGVHIHTWCIDDFQINILSTQSDGFGPHCTAGTSGHMHSPNMVLPSRSDIKQIPYCATRDSSLALVRALLRVLCDERSMMDPPTCLR